MKRKILYSVLLIISLLTIGLNQAQAQYDRDQMATEAGYVKSIARAEDAVLVSSPAFVYGVTVWADAANSYCKLWDDTAAPSAGTTNKYHKVEVGVATQYTSSRYTFNPPIQFERGVYLDATAGSCVVEYR